MIDRMEVDRLLSSLRGDDEEDARGGGDVLATSFVELRRLIAAGTVPGGG